MSAPIEKFMSKTSATKVDPLLTVAGSIKALTYSEMLSLAEYIYEAVDEEITVSNLAAVIAQWAEDYGTEE